MPHFISESFQILLAELSHIINTVCLEKSSLFHFSWDLCFLHLPLSSGWSQMLLEKQPYYKSHSSTPAIAQTGYTCPLEMTNWRKRVPRSSCAGEDTKRGLKESQTCTSSDSPKTPKAKSKLFSEKGRGLGREMVQLGLSPEKKKEVWPENYPRLQNGSHLTWNPNSLGWLKRLS